MLSNFHTHSTFCDGKNSPEEMVREAISQGLPVLGFSGHSNTPFDPGYCMDEDREKAYIEEVRRLQQVYRNQIKIYLGLEQDYYSAPADPAYQYLIGSVHYVKKGENYISVDDTPEIFSQGVENFYGGDYYSLIEDYYALEADVVRRTGCQIVGHFDLITKFNEKYRFFDDRDSRYRDAALQALHSLHSQGVLLEINTGAMSRGWRTAPYPADFLLEELGKLGGKIILSSDAHRREDLLFGFSQARKAAQKYHVEVVDLPPLR